MKRSVLILAVIILAVYSCDSRLEDPVSPPVRELSIPEMVEQELVDITSRDWKSLSDTLAYFDSTMLSKGITRGIAPDGVYYELVVRARTLFELDAAFMVEDSLWAKIKEDIIPFEMKLFACDTEIAIKQEKKDTCSLSALNLKVMAPLCFLTDNRHKAPLLYMGQRVGYLTLAEFENLDYSTGICLVVHYYNDARTFVLFDGGLVNLLKTDLPDAIE